MAVRVLIAPQEFKGSLSAEEAADAIASGLRAARADWRLDLLPFADGGPGFIDALRRAVRADTKAAVVHDALGRPVLGRYIVVRATGEAVVEAAQANGTAHVGLEERDPLGADSFGVGELIGAALEAAPRRLIVGVGGSATTDGGAGMARALGARFTDEAGNPLESGGGALSGLARIDWQPPKALAGCEVLVATDVTNPLTGPEGAAVVYGPQKGADPEQVDILEAALVRFAAVVRRSLGVDVERLAGAGAAGGLAAGLVAFLGGRIVSGFEVVAEAAGLAERLRAADVVLTGEGSFDWQSFHGKTSGRLAELCRQEGKRCVVFAGRTDRGSGEGLELRTLDEIEPGLTKRMAKAIPTLRALANRWALEQDA